MGNYNPYAPIILGQEWVPIRDEDTVFAPQLNTAEYGHGFTLAATRTLQEARFYVSDIPANLASAAVGIAVYPRGLEAASGPIRRVVIPVDAVAVTGVTASPSSTPGPAILFTPDLGGYYLFSTSTTDSVMYLNFNTQEYTVLTGKRILAVNLLFAAHKIFGSDEPDLGPQIGIQDSTALFGEIDYSDGNEIPEGAASFGTFGTMRLRFGDLCPFPPSGFTPETSVPWVYPDDLGRFDSSSPNPLYVTVKTGQNHLTPPTGGVMYFWYAALEVIFCEEQRLAYGFGRPALPGGFPAGEGPDWGANRVVMRTMPARGLLPALDPGDYTVTMRGFDDGNRATPFTAGMRLNALRELYAIPPHPGLRLNAPYPPEDYLDDEFTAIQTHVLPQISLHTSGGTLTEPHAYGRQGKAPVYGGITAIQDIYDDISGVAADYPQVRFYARKYDTTTVPLKLDSTNVTGSGLSVQITPAEHDALPEIIDGWKECTLRFPTAPSMGTVAGNPAWRFSSVGERSGSQWQVLSACAPAVSGVPGSLLTQATPVHRLGTATYQPPAGDTVELTWMSPYATGAVEDADCDAVLIFSQDPATVTGVSVSQATQAITGAALNCGAVPCCIATGIGYNRITWGLPVNTGVADDDFDRIEAAGSWGNASDGKAWTLADLASDYSVDGDKGLITPTVLNSFRRAWVDVGGPDQDVTVEVRISEEAESGNLRAAVLARVTDASNYYFGELRYSATAASLVLTKRVAAAETQLVNITLGSLLPAQTTPRKIRMQVQGTAIRVKAWDSDQPEPWWQIQTTDTDLTTGNNAGVYARDETSTDTTTFYFDDFTVRPPDFAFGGIEMQRWDARTGGDFQTIMLASSPAVTGFSDYEARVGEDSVYRIRNVNIYNFAGPWSTYVTGAPAAPGVSGAVGCDLTGVMIFTSNADQTGVNNCAYIPQWTSDPLVEGFSLLEAQRVSFQELYDRDGRIAFHGTERGLEAFSRTLLIQDGVADPVVLANARTLRELAWADLPYVCVRDDVGNRWFANTRVFDVAAQDDRTKILAVVEVVETTTGPCVVDPA